MNFKSKLIVLAIAGAFVVPAFADQQSGGSSTNTNTVNVGGVNGGTHTQTIGNTSATGGAGGAGGNVSGNNFGGQSSSVRDSGNSSVGNGIGNFSPSATGGSVKDSGNSFNVNANKNTNTNKNTAVSGSSSGAAVIIGNVSGGGYGEGQSSGGKQGDVLSPKQHQSQKQQQSNDQSNNNGNVVNQNYAAPQIPVATAYAPPIQPTAPCALPISGGVQVMNFGGSFGTAYIVEKCEEREAQRMDVESARGIASLGGSFVPMAQEILCSNPSIKAKAPKACGAADKKAEATTVTPVVLTTPIPEMRPTAETVVVTPVKPQERVEARPLSNPAGDPQITETTVGNDRWVFRNGSWIVNPK